MKSGDLEFRTLDVTIESSQDNKTSCEIHRKIEFGILFTSDMEKAIIRCKVMNTFFQDSSAFYSHNETILLISGKITCVQIRLAILKFYTIIDMDNICY